MIFTSSVFHDCTVNAVGIIIVKKNFMIIFIEYRLNKNFKKRGCINCAPVA